MPLGAGRAAKCRPRKRRAGVRRLPNGPSGADSPEGERIPHQGSPTRDYPALNSSIARRVRRRSSGHTLCSSRRRLARAGSAPGGNSDDRTRPEDCTGRARRKVDWHGPSQSRRSNVSGHQCRPGIGSIGPEAANGPQPLVVAPGTLRADTPPGRPRDLGGSLRHRGAPRAAAPQHAECLSGYPDERGQLLALAARAESYRDLLAHTVERMGGAGPVGHPDTAGRSEQLGTPPHRPRGPHGHPRRVPRQRVCAGTRPPGPDRPAARHSGAQGSRLAGVLAAPRQVRVARARSPRWMCARLG